MFREMRRSDRALSNEDAIKLLIDGKTAVLSVNGEDGYPYDVPMNYTCENSVENDEDIVIYFHSATSGHKIDAINANDKVSVCVIGSDELIPEEFSTDFSSVIAFGRTRVVEDANERVHALKMLINKYALEYANKGDAYIDKYEQRSAVAVIAVTVEHISGKARNK